VFIVITYTFEFYMLPVALLILYVKNYVIYALTGRQIVTRDEDEVGFATLLTRCHWGAPPAASDSI
ncbi:hypothetical protein AVEN_166859-1, partial [Araneus ventricosus]